MAAQTAGAEQAAGVITVNPITARFGEQRRVRVVEREIMVSGDARAFYAELAVGVTMHNQAASLRDCLASISEQCDVPLPFTVLLLDDNSTDAWQVELETLATSVPVAVAQVRCGSAARARNCLLDVANGAFPVLRWVARLDADDRFASPDSLAAAVRLALASNARFVLGGNRLRRSGVLLGRTNPATPDLLNSSFVISRLAQMARGEPEAELPSCNLLLASGVPWRYPDQTSAEDHWLVAELLLRHPNLGRVLAEPFYADYSLGGAVTSANHRQARHLAARQALWQTAQGWMGKERSSA